MKSKVLQLVLNTMAELPGLQNLGEAASDYWRLYLRLDHHSQKSANATA